MSSSGSSSSSSCPVLYDLIVIGGGVVGLACLRAATLMGWNCVLVEAEHDLLVHASGRNSGVVCTGVDASPGSLERALIRDSISQLKIYCNEHNIPHRPCGSLVCCWPWDDENDVSNSDGNDDDDCRRIDNDDDDNNNNKKKDSLYRVLDESHYAGDTHATLLTGEQVLMDYEPNLAPTCRGAVHVPGEMVMDPWLYSISLAAHAVENGATIYTNFPVDVNLMAFQDGIWTIRRRDPEVDSSSSSTQQKNDCKAANDQTTIQELRGVAIVNAAGIWSDLIESSIHGSCKWAAKPRRGQYRIYNANTQTCITHPIQPIPTQRTKGIFVFSTIYNHLVVGPTAVDQSSRTDCTVDPQVAQELDKTIQRIIPRLDPTVAYVGEYVGIRPGTDQRDYQIYLVPNKHWVVVAGIRSTGLTASLGIGNYVKRLLQSVLPSPTADQGPSKKKIQTSPMPSIEDLAVSYQRESYHDTSKRDDGVFDGGYVHIHGRRYRVTHPITRFGLESLVEAKFSLPANYTNIIPRY